MSDFYDEDSLFCADCTEDLGLSEKIQRCSMKGDCSICHAESVYVITFRELASWLEEIWSKWYHIGESHLVASPDSDRTDYEQKGDEPQLLLGELIQCVRDDEKIIGALIEIMSEGDTYNVMQGGEALIEPCQCYQKHRLHLTEVEYRWERFVQSLKHHTRYFNTSAKEFFDSLFDGLQEIHSRELPLNCQVSINQSISSNKQVVVEYAPKSMPIFRARKIANNDEFKKIIGEPNVELSNPPDEFASEGRMNPKGISYFYGAVDRETCVAELRPSMGERVISGEFELTKKVALLDLTLLSTSYHKKMESMFEDDYLEKRIARELLRQLERLIAQPVLEGDEFDYLPTQAMSEYLARHATPRIDGIVFKSVQRQGGKNIVLFPDVLRKDNHSANEFGTEQSGIKLNPESLMLHQVKRITHETTERRIDDSRIPDFFENLDDDLNYFFMASDSVDL
jgi:hypothetical protein